MRWCSRASHPVAQGAPSRPEHPGEHLITPLWLLRNGACCSLTFFYRNYLRFPPSSSVSSSKSLPDSQGYWESYGEFHISFCESLLKRASFSYFGKPGLLFVRLPSDLHEAPIGTLDRMLTDQGVRLPFPSDVALARVHHNKALRTDEDTIIPDLLLQFSAKDDSSAPIYPVICQIAFSQSFEDARNDIRSLTDAYSSICMAIIIDIEEDPAYRSPMLGSEAWKTLSHAYMDYVSFVNSSSYCRGSSTPGFSVSFSEPLTAGGHTWCSITKVTYHVWLKACDSEQLNVNAMTGDRYASCVSPLFSNAWYSC